MTTHTSYTLKTMTTLLLGATFLLSISLASAQNAGGLYKPARGGGQNVEFGGQGISGGKSSGSGGRVQKRSVSKYYAERCLRPGPVMHCTSTGKCVERPKPAVCSEAGQKEKEKRAEREAKPRVSALARTRARRAEEAARREQVVDSTGAPRAGEVRITPSGDTVTVRPVQPAKAQESGGN